MTKFYNSIQNGKVKFPSDKVFKTQFGDRVKAVINIGGASGQDITIWGNVGDPVQKLSKGEEVAIIHKERDKWALVFEDRKQEKLEFECSFSADYLEEVQLKAADKGTKIAAIIRGLASQLPQLKANELAPYAMLIYKEIE